MLLSSLAERSRACVWSRLVLGGPGSNCGEGKIIYLFMLSSLQSSMSQIVSLIIVKVKHDSQGNDIFFTSQGVSFSEVLEGLK